MLAFSKVDLRAMSWPHSAKCIAHGALFQGLSKVRNHSAEMIQFVEEVLKCVFFDQFASL